MKDFDTILLKKHWYVLSTKSSIPSCYQQFITSCHNVTQELFLFCLFFMMEGLYKWFM